MKKKKRERGNPLKQGGTILLNNPKKNGNRTFSTNVFFLKFLPSKDQKKKKPRDYILVLQKDKLLGVIRFRMFPYHC